jgi:hypothetical protein
MCGVIWNRDLVPVDLVVIASVGVQIPGAAQWLAALELSTAHVRLVASALGVSERTVWSWLSAARHEGRTGPRPRSRFVVTREIRDLLALWGGNVSAVHRELVEGRGHRWL